MRVFLSAVALVGLTSACALANGGGTGFAMTDLSGLNVDSIPVKLSGPRLSRVQPNRASIICARCAELEAVDILLGKSTDGTEGRLRSGVTTVAAMEKLCQARGPAPCTMEKVEKFGATGYVSRTAALGLPVSTTVLFKQGDMLTIRSIGATADLAFSNGQTVLNSIGAQVIGPQ
jgi:hypothetical protein